jgi:hypothetical protein
MNVRSCPSSNEASFWAFTTVPLGRNIHLKGDEVMGVCVWIIGPILRVIGVLPFRIYIAELSHLFDSTFNLNTIIYKGKTYRRNSKSAFKMSESQKTPVSKLSEEERKRRLVMKWKCRKLSQDIFDDDSSDRRLTRTKEIPTFEPCSRCRSNMAPKSTCALWQGEQKTCGTIESSKKERHG